MHFQRISFSPTCYVSSGRFYDYLSQILYCRTDGSDGWCAVTQFEASDARRCFPCWDEPALKATFTITLNVPADRVALSNMVSADVKRLCGLNWISLRLSWPYSLYI